MRLIDADKAHQELASCIADCCGQSGTYEEGLCDAMSVLDGQPTVGKDMNVPAGWVSVKDRLPKDERFVLVCNDDGKIMVAQYISETVQWQFRYTAYDVDVWDDSEQGPVCWWMPLPVLPEPPKEDDNETD